MAVEKIKILWAVWQLPAKQHCQSAHFAQFLGKWAELAVLIPGNSKTATMILIFLIVLDAEYSLYVK